MTFHDAARALPEIRKVLHECEHRYRTVTDCNPLMDAVDVLSEYLVTDICPWGLEGIDKELCPCRCDKCEPPKGVKPWQL